jgi:hypothetical protein
MQEPQFGTADGTGFCSMRLHKSHKVPSALLNFPLEAIFSAEPRLGDWLSFPWGTSLLGIFCKP